MEAGRVMWIDPDRVLYAGLLGTPSLRSLGAYVIYVGLEAPIDLSIADREWQCSLVAVVPPYVPHRVRCEARGVGVILIEPETVEEARLPQWLRGRGGIDERAFVERVRAACARLRIAGDDEAALADFDTTVLGERLPPRKVDARIRAVLDAIKRDPCARNTGEAFAADTHLSLSRFVHLFKAEVGVPFRRFRSWRRARHLLHRATSDAPLVEIALDAGYPDSTHFSHSIRLAFGLTPKAILAGSRKLAVRGRHSGAG
ncbi:AraC family transcriptional regulator [Ramlibacter sp. 2FC]|uniref:AraC family transcriptional regulator n=1 Tax=Ramlibacter sp. 2FC TaxID=2502188 RepID=UPI00201DD8B8|nr:AraC family transcriptional regulator [Ramlibacter sp. 2FC]